MTGYVLRLEGLLPTCACAAFGAGFFLLFVYATYESEWPVSGVNHPEVRRLRPVVLATIGWNALYFCFLQGQHAAAFWVHKHMRNQGNKREGDGSRRAQLTFAEVKYGPVRSNGPSLILTMDRSVGNLLEQTPPFLVSMWLHAFVASAHDAAWFGWCWLLLRASYPIAFAHPSMTPALWGVQRRMGISWITFVTWPSYAIIWRLLLLFGTRD